MYVTQAPGVWELGTEGSIWFAVIAAIVSGIAAGGAVLSALSALTARRRAKSAGGTTAAAVTLDDKIKSLGDLAEMLRLMAADVTAEAEAQIRVAQDAAKEARANERLASLTREQAEAVSEIFAEQGRTSMRESKRFGRVSLIISIIVGNVVTVVVTVLLTMSMR
jgi:hypothetical protein